MKKLQPILIIITFLIAVFFFVKWVNDVRPRHEWQESIREVGFMNFSRDDEFCEILEIETFSRVIEVPFASSTNDVESMLHSNEFIPSFNKWNPGMEIIYEFKEYYVYRTEAIRLCYKKEKVRIN